VRVISRRDFLEREGEREGECVTICPRGARVTFFFVGLARSMRNSRERETHRATNIHTHTHTHTHTRTHMRGSDRWTRIEKQEWGEGRRRRGEIKEGIIAAFSTAQLIEQPICVTSADRRSWLLSPSFFPLFPLSRLAISFPLARSASPSRGDLFQNMRCV